MYKPSQIAELEKVKVLTVWNWIKQKKLKADKLMKGCRYYYSIKEEYYNDFKENQRLK